MKHTIFNYKSVGEENIMPSQCIPGHDIRVGEALDYLNNGIPIPDRFLSKRFVDKNNDGILDSNVSMFDMLDVLHEKSVYENKIYLKLKSTEIRNASIEKSKEDDPKKLPEVQERGLESEDA